MIKIENLDIYLDNNQIISSLNLVIPKSQLHVIMGPNGSGKSTLANSIMGNPKYRTTGQIFLENSDVSEFSIEQRARAGLFLSAQQAFSIPGVKVFTFLKEVYRVKFGDISKFQQELYSVLDLVKLDHSFAYRNLFEGFSGGEKKKFEIVQLLLLKPKVAILDEIDSGLDVDALKIIAQAVNIARQSNPELTILLITHYSNILQYFQVDQVHLLISGKIIKSGNFDLATKTTEHGYAGL